MKKISLQTFLEHANKWIGLTPKRDKILVTGSSLVEVNQQLEKLKIKDAIITYVIPSDYYIAPVCQS